MTKDVDLVRIWFCRLATILLLPPTVLLLKRFVDRCATAKSALGSQIEQAENRRSSRKSGVSREQRQRDARLLSLSKWKLWRHILTEHFTLAQRVCAPLSLVSWLALAQLFPDPAAVYDNVPLNMTLGATNLSLFCAVTCLVTCSELSTRLNMNFLTYRELFDRVQILPLGLLKFMLKVQELGGVFLCLAVLITAIADYFHHEVPIVWPFGIAGGMACSVATALSAVQSMILATYVDTPESTSSVRSALRELLVRSLVQLVLGVGVFVLLLQLLLFVVDELHNGDWDYAFPIEPLPDGVMHAEPYIQVIGAIAIVIAGWIPAARESQESPSQSTTNRNSDLEMQTGPSRYNTNRILTVGNIVPIDDETLSTTVSVNQNFSVSETAPSGSADAGESDADDL
ncbi:MAG: hypothetical protein MHM6MM_004553 [Cercozoa sp. M6MM]